MQLDALSGLDGYCVTQGLKAVGATATVTVKVTQLCLTLCDPMDYTVHGILQARILEWVAHPLE